MYEQFNEARELIKKGDHSKALNAYYLILGDLFYSELNDELLYLKRLSNIPISGRDLLFFRRMSSRNELITSHISEYVYCIDAVLANKFVSGQNSPLDILLCNSPTIEQILDKKLKDLHLGVYLNNKEITIEDTPITINNLTNQFDACPPGILFDSYTDQVKYCRVYECQEISEYEGLLTNYSPDYLASEITDKGLHINWIDAYRHRSWKNYRWHNAKRRYPDFLDIHSKTELEKVNCFVYIHSSHWAAKYSFPPDYLKYTGRIHKIDGEVFYEICVIRYEPGDEINNPFIELVDDILREAENLLRDQYGLPRIGEGWISESQLYRLVKNILPDAEQHAIPSWLKPQHLDIYIPSKKIAIEYQGLQHYQAVDYFGGQDALEITKKRDIIKSKKCKSNSVTLIYWPYDLPIDQDTLLQKLIMAGVQI